MASAEKQEKSGRGPGRMERLPYLRGATSGRSRTRRRRADGAVARLSRRLRQIERTEETHRFARSMVPAEDSCRRREGACVVVRFSWPDKGTTLREVDATESELGRREQKSPGGMGFATCSVQV